MCTEQLEMQQKNKIGKRKQNLIIVEYPYKIKILKDINPSKYLCRNLGFKQEYTSNYWFCQNKSISAKESNRYVRQFYKL